MTIEDLSLPRRGEYIPFFAAQTEPSRDLAGYRAVLSHDDLDTDRPIVDRLRDSDHFRGGDVIVIEGDSGFVRSLYRLYDDLITPFFLYSKHTGSLFVVTCSTCPSIEAARTDLLFACEIFKVIRPELQHRTAYDRYNARGCRCHEPCRSWGSEPSRSRPKRNPVHVAESIRFASNRE